MGRLRAKTFRAARNVAVVVTALSLSALAVVTLAGGTAGATSTSSGPNCTPSGGGNVCVLDPTGSDALAVTGTSSLAVDRDIVVDSSAAEAAIASDSSTVTAAAIGGPGGFNTSNGGSFTPTPVTIAAQPDPFAGSSVSHGDCSTPGSSLGVSSGTMAATPGNYSSLSASSTGTLQLDPGVYTITGSFGNSGGGTITGTGVTLYFCPGADFSLLGSSSTTLSAPGGNNGFLIFFDPTNTGSFSTGTVTTNLVGNIYAKSATLQLHNLTVQGDIVADDISIQSGGAVKVTQGTPPTSTTTTTTTTTATTTTTTTTASTTTTTTTPVGGGGGGGGTPTPTPTTTPAVVPTTTVAPLVVTPAPPAISILKTERDGSAGAYVRGPITVKVGDTIEYEVVVSNTGPTPLVISLTDPRCVRASGSKLSVSNVSLAVGGSVTYHCSHVAVAADEPSYTNTATASGVSPTGAQAGPVSSSVKATLRAPAVLAKRKVLTPAAPKSVTKKAAPPKPVSKPAAFTG